MTEQPAAVEVKCGSCTLCCKDQTIYLFPKLGDDAMSYETQLVTNPATGRPVLALKQKPNLDCIYLGEGGCTIHDRRPTQCRLFSCVEVFQRTSRLKRERMIGRRPSAKAIFARGRELLQGAPK